VIFYRQVLKKIKRISVTMQAMKGCEYPERAGKTNGRQRDEA
jgi:hypothetical protein